MKEHKEEKKIYIIGHRNPDTDSIVSAVAYAAYKKKLGINCIAARAGKVTPQTEYIFNRFGLSLPDFIPDLIPKVEYYYNREIEIIKANTSFWDAMEILDKKETRVLPVVTETGHYHSLLHYMFFAQKLSKMINPHQRTVIQTSIQLLASVLRASVLVAINKEELRTSPIIIAAAGFTTFCQHLASYDPENTIVIVGNRRNIQQQAIESKVRAIIITGGMLPDQTLCDLAKKQNVSILISPYDTASTSLLIIYSMPVSCLSNTAIQPINKSVPIQKLNKLLGEAPGKSLPVVDDNGIVLGIISESDLWKEPNIEVILVDHNERSQAVEGVEHYRILEIIDHHRLGNLSTRYPITFINKPVGATCTIIANLFQENHIPIPKEIASILLCGILADTLALQSATATKKDHETAEYLSHITSLDIKTLGKEIIAASGNITGRTAKELILQDMKEYTEKNCIFTISQIEVEVPNIILSRKKEFLEILEAQRKEKNGLFSALMITNITELSSLLLIATEKTFEHFFLFPQQEENVYQLGAIVSRKKQLLPFLSEILDQYIEK